MLNIAVIGCGYWGPNLIRNFNSLSGCTVKIACDLDRGRLDHMQSLYPDIKTTKDFDQLINSAVQNNNYKLAVRYLFLKLLKLLSDEEIIQYRKDKTNHQYLKEIDDIQVSNAFKDTAYRFEWIWYGDFPIDKAQMENSKNEFNKLFELVKSQ